LFVALKVSVIDSIETNQSNLLEAIEVTLEEGVSTELEITKTNEG